MISTRFSTALIRPRYSSILANLEGSAFSMCSSIMCILRRINGSRAAGTVVGWGAKAAMMVTRTEIKEGGPRPIV